jgi:hypothetical protein
MYYDFQNCGKFWDDILLPKKERKTLYGIEMADVRMFAGRNPSMIPPPLLICQKLRKVLKSKVK